MIQIQLIKMKSQKSIVKLLILINVLFFTLNTFNSFSQNGISVNTTGTASDNSAMLDVSSTSLGLLVPRMTTTQRDAIVLPALSLLIFNTITNCFEAFVNGVWYSLSCAPCTKPAAPTEGTNAPCQTQITWNWNTVTGATGFKWNTVNNYETAIYNGSGSNYIQTGLTCNTFYSLYIWSYNNCGNSDVTSLTQSTTVCSFTCGGNLVITHTAGNVAPVTETVTYGTVLTDIAGTGNKCWITQNLGAKRQATAPGDISDDAAGWYWQFNRSLGYAVGPNPSWDSSYSNYGNNDWDLTYNDPCNLLLCSGWRLPTDAEWIGVKNSLYGNNTDNLYNSPIHLHAAGYLWDCTGCTNPPFPNGTLSYRGIFGQYWSSDNGNNDLCYPLWCHGLMLYFQKDNFINSSQDFGKLNGLSVRCLMD
jgi:uncharacterized protein (TIGR02145 family)